MDALDGESRAPHGLSEVTDKVADSEGQGTRDDVVNKSEGKLANGELNGAQSLTSKISDRSPDIIPLQVLGSIDCDLSKITANELMAWGLKNMWVCGQEGAYAVGHSQDPVSDWPQHPRNGDDQSDELDPSAQHNFFEKAFPCLFPYGLGGLEACCPVEVDFCNHIKWLLQYYDCCFKNTKCSPLYVLESCKDNKLLHRQGFKCNTRHSNEM